MQISTFTGTGDFEEAIEKAEEGAQRLLTSLSHDELVSVQAQTIITEYQYYHVITVTYE